jgi:peptide/histidine transporter 3/4
MYFQVVFSRYSIATYFTSEVNYSGGAGDTAFVIFYCLFYLMYPVFGLLADLWIGRYRAITIGICICFISIILSSTGIIVNEIFHYTLYWIIFMLAYFLSSIGYTNFRANITQYNVDQLVGASSDQLTTVIYCHSAAIPIVFGILQLFRCTIHYNILIYLSLILSGVAVSVVLVTHSLCNHWLECVSQIDNPIKLIGRVLNYARKHKYPENRSALTYWEEESPSRLDLGKDKYGGPFTEEQVENVKTVLSILPLFVAVIGSGFTEEIFWNAMCCELPKPSPIVNCLVSTTFFRQVTSAFLMILYIMLRFCFHKCVPSMLKRIGFGLVFALAAMVSFSFILHYHPNSDKFYYHDALVAPHVLYGIAYFLIFPTSFEFTIAQSPVQMRSLMIGLWYISLGIGYTISINLKYFF